MIYGAILGGGKGQRMGYTEKPKQFLLLGDKPLFIHCVEKFLLCSRLDKIYVAVPKDWMPHTLDTLRKYIPNTDRITVCAGGDDRNTTIMNVLAEIEREHAFTEEDVIITHDAVRPFVTCRILDENIDAALSCGACDTAIPATDTIAQSADGLDIDAIPPRGEMYQGQTPQSFNILRLKSHYLSLTNEEKAALTDACKIFTLKGEKVRIVRGTVYNIKITTPYDLKVANALLKEELDD